MTPPHATNDERHADNQSRFAAVERKLDALYFYRNFA